MGTLRPPGRDNDPLNVLVIAAALVVAAIAGAALGFALDFISGGSAHNQSGADKGR
ncbi:MAG TPA: hypothetical protein VF418_15590 [Sphingomonadaceae bacterium]